MSGSGSNAWLNTIPDPPGKHAYSTPSTIIWQTGSSSTQCVQNLSVTATYQRFPNKTFTYGAESLGLWPNSNTFTYSLLKLSGVKIPFAVALALGNRLTPLVGLQQAPGWGTILKW